MMTCPREPRPGEPITATWMASLVRYVKAITPLPGPNTKISRGPNGSVITGTPGGARTASGKDLLPWHIISTTREETVEGETKDVPVRICDDCYWMDGQIMRKYTPKLESEAIEDFVCQGELVGSQEYTNDDKPYLCYKFKSALGESAYSEEAIVGYKKYDDMLADMKDRTLVVIPLYLLKHSGSVKLDFRATPGCQQFEIA